MLKNRFELNIGKAIGKVVFIVEGTKKEFSLLTHIFHKLLKYNVVQMKKGQEDVVLLENPNNLYDEVFIINALNSNISCLKSESGTEHLDRVFNKLTNEYNVDVFDSALFYVFDRDNLSNKADVVEELLSILGSSRDNGVEMNGLLLISYPCVEYYVVSCFDGEVVDTGVKTAKHLKKYIDSNKMNQTKITSDMLLTANNCMISKLEDIIGDFEVSYLDNFAYSNMEIFKYEEKQLNLGRYDFISLVSLAFLDLGIIRVVE